MAGEGKLGSPESFGKILTSSLLGYAGGRGGNMINRRLAEKGPVLRTGANVGLGAITGAAGGATAAVMSGEPVGAAMGWGALGGGLSGLLGSGGGEFMGTRADGLGLYGGHKANQIADKYGGATWGDFGRRALANAQVGGKTGAVGNVGSTNISGWWDNSLPTFEENLGNALISYGGGFVSGGISSAGGDTVRGMGESVRKAFRPKAQDSEIVDTMIDYGNALPSQMPNVRPHPPSPKLQAVSDFVTQVGQGGAVVAGNSGSLVGQGLAQLGYNSQAAEGPRENYDIRRLPGDIENIWRDRLGQLCRMYPNSC